jgi:hypothetical protein
MVDWTRGLTQTELDEAQARYGVRFPPDMVELYRERWPAKALDWSKESSEIRDKLAWPLEMLLWDVEHGSWWADWGGRPSEKPQREEIVRQTIAAVPRLIPLWSHRFIPEDPHESGNPVFSMHGFDTIFYGGDLAEYFANELSGGDLLGGIPREMFGEEHVPRLRHIPFWSELAMGSEKWIIDDE